MADEEVTVVAYLPEGAFDPTDRARFEDSLHETAYQEFGLTTSDQLKYSAVNHSDDRLSTMPTPIVVMVTAVTTAGAVQTDFSVFAAQRAATIAQGIRLMDCVREQLGRPERVLTVYYFSGIDAGAAVI